jgi:hypothetical protein
MKARLFATKKAAIKSLKKHASDSLSSFYIVERKGGFDVRHKSLLRDDDTIVEDGAKLPA